MSRTKNPRRSLVGETAARMRELVFSVPAGRQIGSLPDLARALGVGIVTVQQAARVLEHEGLLKVRRGPGGGYYGARPDELAVERMVAAYLRTRPASFAEALDITSLLFTELVAAAAAQGNEAGEQALRAYASRLDNCRSVADLGQLEEAFQDILFAMVDWPLFELLTRVTLRIGEMRNEAITDAVTFAQWREGRHRIVEAILRRDPELARFEADRNNRRIIRHYIGAKRIPHPA